MPDHWSRTLVTLVAVIYTGVSFPQAELSISGGYLENGTWRTRSGDGRGSVQAKIGPSFTVGVGFADRIGSETGAMVKAGLHYTELNSSIVEYQSSLCCSNRDSASISNRYIRLDIGPEFEIGRNTRLNFPVEFSWLVSSEVSGLRSTFIPPSSSTTPYTNERSSFGKFDLAIGAGLSWRLPLNDAYSVSLGPKASLGLWDQMKSAADIRLWNYGAVIGLHRRMASPGLFE